MKLNIGLRIYKTAIAIFLCVLLSKAFEFSAFYACIAAAISMESTVVNSFKAGLGRMKGTFLGAAIGMIFSSIERSNAILCALGSIIIIKVCNSFKWNKYIVISLTVFLSIMLSLTEKTPFEYSFFRLVDTFIGIAISVAVNYLVFTPNIHDRIREKGRIIEEDIREKLDSIALNAPVEELQHLKSHINTYQEFLKHLEKESILYREDSSKHEYLLEALRIYEIIHVYLESLSLINNVNCQISKENLEGISVITGRDYALAVDTGEHNEENIIYNYDIKKIIKAYNSITSSK